MSEDHIETRTVYDVAPWRVQVEMFTDGDSDPRTDGDWAGTAEVDAWREGCWQYVGLVAHVDLHGVELGSGSLWSIAHGRINDDVTTDAWEEVPAVYIGITSTESPPMTYSAVQMSSQLNGVVCEAIEEAQQWLRKIGADVDATPLLDRFDPNRGA